MGEISSFAILRLGDLKKIGILVERYQTLNPKPQTSFATLHLGD